MQVRFLSGLRPASAPVAGGECEADIMKAKIEELRGFMQEVNQEVRRVTWPTTKEIAGATVVVVITTAALSLLLFVLDFVIARVLAVVLG